MHLVALVVAGQRVHHEVHTEAIGQHPLPRMDKTGAARAIVAHLAGMLPIR